MSRPPPPSAPPVVDSHTRVAAAGGAAELTDDDAEFRLIAQSKELEKELKLLLAAKSSAKEHVQKIQSLRNQLKAVYVQVITDFPVVAASNDIELNLWKNVIYRRIEEFRSKLRTLQAKNSDFESIRRVKEAFQKSLRNFQSVYSELLDKQLKGALIERDTNGSFVDLIHLSGHISDDERKVLLIRLQSCHKCLVYLGDLERYYETTVNEAERDWSKPASFYSQAIQLWPDNGNPHNQLAVLEVNKGKELAALYRYFRSLAVSDVPFQTAQNNIQLLFQKNAEKCNQLLDRNDRLDGNKNDLSTFHICMIRCFALLMEKSQKSQEFFGTFFRLFATSSLIPFVTEIVNSNNPSSRFVDLKNFADMKLHLLLCAVITFHLYCSDSAEDRFDGLSFIVGIVSELIDSGIYAFRFREGRCLDSVLLSQLVSLDCIGVFCDWLRQNPDVLKHPILGSNSLFWSKFAQFLSIVSFVKKNLKCNGKSSVVLNEERELQGLKFFNSAGLSDNFYINRSSPLGKKGFSRISPPDSLLDETDFVMKRCNKIANFAQWILASYSFLSFDQNLKTYACAPEDVVSGKLVVDDEIPTERCDDVAMSLSRSQSPPSVNVNEGNWKPFDSISILGEKEDKEHDNLLHDLNAGSKPLDLLHRQHQSPPHPIQKGYARGRTNSFSNLDSAVLVPAAGSNRPKSCITPPPQRTSVSVSPFDDPHNSRMSSGQGFAQHQHMISPPLEFHHVPAGGYFPPHGAPPGPWGHFAHVPPEAIPVHPVYPHWRFTPAPISLYPVNGAIGVIGPRPPFSYMPHHQDPQRDPFIG